MLFPISGVHINPALLALVGFVVGVFGGFFGVGGSFLAGPALFGFGVPMNFVVGTDLAHIVGKSIVAARKHRKLGNIDLKLGGIMALGTIGGVEVGAQFIQYLKKTAQIDAVVGISFIVILVGISSFMAWETFQTIKTRRGKAPAARAPDASAFQHIAKKLQRWGLPPYVDLPVSGIKRISVWTIVFVSFFGGFFSGFLGGGAGYIRMPSMIYLLGIPTHVAVGTDLFEIIISAGYGTFSHALKGNVDILIALVMHTGGAIGAQLGATMTQYFTGVRIRVAFIPLPLIGAAIILHGLLTGHKAP
ncbi:MAG TPA: sulfite exporter TauE/SafE family protein [Verrucomicrobiae bacterium]|nr:sulfite exporter TauE/SafE family protein [Verrucomicrobiae bacterium]